MKGGGIPLKYSRRFAFISVFIAHIFRRANEMAPVSFEVDTEMFTSFT